MMVWYPIVMAVFGLGALFQDKQGKNPKWLVRLLGAVFRGVWQSYDGFYKGVFGDGERTQEGPDGRGDGMRGKVGKPGATGEKGGGQRMEGEVV